MWDNEVLGVGRRDYWMNRIKYHTQLPISGPQWLEEQKKVLGLIHGIGVYGVYVSVCAGEPHKMVSRAGLGPRTVCCPCLT